MQTSPLLHENRSFILSNPINALGEEHQSYDTTIPFLDDIQQSSSSMRSCEISSKQRTRKCSRLSERPTADNESTVTVKFQSC